MDDLISRQAALNELYHNRSLFEDFNKLDYWDKCRVEEIDSCIAVLVNLPSAQPEIVRCKDCEHSEHWCGDKCRCFLWVDDGISVFDDGFCNRSGAHV